jgi:hypothetical protein
MSFDPGAGVSAQSAVRELRPLSIGEMLDRAFSICFKNMLPFLAIVTIVFIPQIVFYYFGMKDMFGMWSDMMGSISTGADPSSLSPEKILQAEANGSPFIFFASLIAVFLIPLSNAAVVSGVSRAYLGLPVRFVQCYADAWPRWGQLILLTLTWFAAIFGALIVFFIAFFIVAAAVAAMIGLLGTVGTIVGVLIGIAVGIVGLLMVFQLYLAAAYSFVAAVLEGTPFIMAFSSGFQRVFGEGQFWRSLAISAAIFGIIFGLELIAGIVGAITIAFTKSFALEFVVSGLVGALCYPFLFAVVAVSYYDVRIRREGFDLQMLAAQLTAAPPPPPTR